MEFPILRELPLPDSCVKIVTQFLREPHPTAMLIKELRFRRSGGLCYIKGHRYKPCVSLNVYGDFSLRNCHKYRSSINGIMSKSYNYNTFFSPISQRIVCVPTLRHFTLWVDHTELGFKIHIDPITGELLADHPAR